MSQRKAVTRAVALRYRSASKAGKSAMLRELCALTGWHRDHARKALRTAFGPKPVAPKRNPRPVIHDDAVMAALRKVWAVILSSSRGSA